MQQLRSSCDVLRMSLSHNDLDSVPSYMPVTLMSLDISRNSIDALPNMGLLSNLRCVYVCLRACVCVRVCVRACVRACVLGMLVHRRGCDRSVACMCPCSLLI
jgi:hypothetical protein